MTQLILLAAGLSRRFGGNKLLADWKGNPLYTYSLLALAELAGQRQDCRLTVVTRYEEIQAQALALGPGSAGTITVRRGSPPPSGWGWRARRRRTFTSALWRISRISPPTPPAAFWTPFSPPESRWAASRIKGGPEIPPFFTGAIGRSCWPSGATWGDAGCWSGIGRSVSSGPDRRCRIWTHHRISKQADKRKSRYGLQMGTIPAFLTLFTAPERQSRR